MSFVTENSEFLSLYPKSTLLADWYKDVRIIQKTYKSHEHTGFFLCGSAYNYNNYFYIWNV